MRYKNIAKNINYKKELIANEDKLIFSQLSNLDYYSPLSIHWNKFFELILVVEGKINITISQHKHTLEKGDVAILNHDEIHIFEKIDPKSTILTLQISPDIFIGDHLKFLDYRFVDHIIKFKDKKTKYVTAFIYIISKLFFDSKVKESKLYKQFALTVFLFQYLHRNLKIDSISSKEIQNDLSRVYRIDYIYNYIHENYNKKIYLSALAEKLDLTLSYLSHFIKDNFNLTFRDYLSEIRFEQAIYRLLTTNKSVNQIALECGFSDARYLTFLFNTYFKISPEDYKRLFPLQNNFDPHQNKNSFSLRETIRGYTSSVTNEKYYEVFDTNYLPQLDVLYEFFVNEF